MNPVELSAVGRRFGDLEALDGVDLTVAPGETLGLLGHNGAGKTTAIKLILGLLQPTRGRVRVFGENPAAAGARHLRRRLGFLPENVSFYPQLSGRETLRYFGRLKGVSRGDCEALLQRVGLGPAADRRVGTYSKGMRQRLGLAQALLGQPRLLLLDEPTVGLDPVAARDFYTVIDELRQQGCSVVLCSHVLPALDRHVDRVAILARGKLIASGRIDMLRRRAGLPTTVALRGDTNRIGAGPLAAAEGVRISEVNGTRIRFEVAPANKMAVLRPLLSDAEVWDVEITAPSLEAIYHHFMGIVGERQ